MSQENQPSEKTKVDRGGVRYIIRTVGSIIIQAIIFFFAVGTLYTLRGWLFYVILTGSTLLTAVLLYIVDPELLNQRGKNPEGAKTWDRRIIVIWGVILFCFGAVAGLDVRYQWTMADFNLIWVGIILFIIGYAMGTWPMLINKHFETTVRIQTDKYHEVITSGPYRLVRHPSYLGGIIGYIGFPLIIGSFLSYIIIGIAIGLIVFRTYLEDTTLQNELVGYKEYIQKTKYRLIPGIW